MRIVQRFSILVAGAFLVGGCSGNPTTPPTRPTPVTSVSAAPTGGAPVPGVPAISELSLLRPTAVGMPTPHNGAYKFGYLIRFALAETSGKSGATIENIQTAIVDRFNTGAGCWRDALRVAPNGTLDTFETDEGANWLAYCAPDAASMTRAASLSVVVTFRDDEGGVGTVQATIPVTW